MSDESLRGRGVLSTGVSRRRGIGFAIASRLVARGADLFLTHHRQHDQEKPWGGDDLVAMGEEIRSRRRHEGARGFANPVP